MKNKQNKGGATQPRISKMPVAIGSSVTKSKVRGTMNDSRFVISNSEYAGLLTNSAGGFQVFPLTATTPGYDICASNRLLFPWLSNIAMQYEKYHFTRLALRLLPLQPTSAAGQVYAMIDYDYDDEIPQDKLSFMQNKDVKSASVFLPMTLTVDIKRVDEGMKWRYTQAGSTGTEQRTVFGGFFVVATDGTTSTVSYDVWVDYSVELDVPCPSSLLVPNTITTNLTTQSQSIVSNGSWDYKPLTLGTTSSSGSAFKVVTPGQAGVPSLALAGASVASALDISNSIGTLALETKMFNSSKTPTDFCVTGSANTNIAAYDAYGTLLNQFATNFLDGLPGVLNAIGINPGQPSNWTVVGEQVASSLAIPIKALRKAFPAAKYLVPFERAVSTSGVLGSGLGFTMVQASM